MVLGSIWEGVGTLWGVCWPLLGASWPFFARSKSSFFLDWVQDRLQEAFWVDFGSIWGRFGEDFGRVWVDLGSILGGFSVSWKFVGDILVSGTPALPRQLAWRHNARGSSGPTACRI